MANKFNEADRTFTTRLEFINHIFSNKFIQSEIMTSCINHKLDGTYNNYLDELEESIMNLKNKNPISVLNTNRKQ